MDSTSHRWNVVTPSNHPWEQEGLDYVRRHLPDRDPYRAWTNFSLTSDDGSIREIDLLVLTPQGLFVVELKAHRGAVSGNAGHWTFRFEGRERTFRNPRLLTDEKAKKLKSRLARTKAFRKAGRKSLPFIEALVFLSATDLSANGLDAFGRQGILVRGVTSSTPIPGLDPLYSFSPRSGPKLGTATARRLDQAMREIGIQRVQATRTVGSYSLIESLDEGPGWQDWRARHEVLKVRRRLRLYHTTSGAETETRKTLLRAARREVLMLEGLDHEGIVKATEYVDSELGPAVIFEDHAEAQPLAAWLHAREARLDFGQRLHLLRQLTEILDYAHGRHLVHRSLSPACILVLEPEAAYPKLAVMSWQTGSRQTDTDDTRASGLRPTLHPERLVGETSAVYLAPEISAGAEQLDGVRADIFSLGAIAYRLFTGEPPADSLAALELRLQKHPGLLVSDAVDGVSTLLADLIEGATRPLPGDRWGRCRDLLEFLDDLLEEFTTPDASNVEPERAKKGDVLPGGYEITSRLGQGSTSIVFEVSPHGQAAGPVQVLKLARNPSKNGFLDDEAEVLENLRHPGIIALIDRVSVGELTGLLLEKAGKETLAQRLREEGRLSLDFLERFGDDLLRIVQWLEERGISHRDIKPENLGVQSVGRNNVLHLVLFDFSLSRAAIDRCDLGTRPYLDPFLRRPDRGRWDLAAERFAAAMTLYQMATGRLPVWGDGDGDPLYAQEEVSLEPELFLPAVREPMTAFFRRALRRDAAERFDNAEQMLREWQRLFFEAERPALPTTHDDADDAESGDALQQAVLMSPIIELGFSTRAFHALERLGVENVEDLLRKPLQKIQRMRGVGPKTRDEIKNAARTLRRRFPDIAPVQSTDEGTTKHDSSATESTSDLGADLHTVDRIASKLIPGRPSRGHRDRALRMLLGLDDEAEQGWTTQTEVARTLGITRARVSQFVGGARKRWGKMPSITAVRADMAQALDDAGGAMTEQEVAAALLATRGALGEPRERGALAVARAASEVERMRGRPRWILRRSGETVVLSRVTGDDEALAQARAVWVLKLGLEADRLAELDPLPAPRAVLDALGSVPRPETQSPPAPTRLVRLAAAASTRAAVSSRAELYPRGLSAARALNLAAGVAQGVKRLTVEQIQERVHSRYPEAEPLPPRPRLDDLLETAGLDLVWQEGDGEEEAGFVPRRTLVTTLSSATASYISRTPRPAPSNETLAAEDFDRRLQRAARDGAYLILLTLPHRVSAARQKLLADYGLEPRSFDRLFLEALRATADELGIEWSVVLDADAAQPSSRDGRNLRRVIDRALPAVEQALLSTEGTVLLTEPGLIGRYDLIPWLERLRDRLARPEAGRALRGLWLLAPSDEQQEGPRLLDRPVPVVGASEYAWVAESWLTGAHQVNGSTESLGER